jgi:hypothetical protein
MPDVDSDPVVPAVVAANHLAASASDLAANTLPDRIGESVPDLGDLAEILRQLVVGQRQIGTALARLADHLATQAETRELAVGPADELSALADVIRAAGRGSGYASGALAALEPVLAIMLRDGGADARLG